MYGSSMLAWADDLLLVTEGKGRDVGDDILHQHSDCKNPRERMLQGCVKGPRRL